MSPLDQIRAELNSLRAFVLQQRHNGKDGQRIDFKNLVNTPPDSSTVLLAGTTPATSGNYGVFFIFPYGGTITGITEVHGTAGSDGSAVTLQIEKLTGTQASGAGVSLLGTSFNLKATANTVQTATLTGVTSNLQFNVGDRLGLVLTGTPTSLADLVVVVQFK